MEQFNPKVRFLVVSDIHYQDHHTIQRDYFERGLELAYEYAEGASYKNLDALFVVGDLANTGTEVQMQAFSDSLQKCVKPETDVTLSIAKHEYHSEGEAAAHEKFARIFKMPADAHKVIKDFHFISLSTTNGDRFDDAKREFAANALRKAAESPKQPIFFFQHPHIRDTVYGSMVWANDDLTAVLMNYPQIIDFSGHSHAPINDPRNIHQRHFTSVGTGTMFYFELDEYDKIYGTIPPEEMPESGRHRVAQMTIVEADIEGRVRILPYDIITEQFFPEIWKIDTPWDPTTFTYTDQRYKTTLKPYFSSSATIEITAITKNSVTFIFDQASIDKEYVNSYDISIIREENGVTVRKISIWSEYYYSDMPKQLTQKIDQLESGVAYQISIRANSFWKTSSEKPLTTSFTTI